MARLSVENVRRATDANGDSVSGATRTIYNAGTTTAVTVYSDVGLTTIQANPLTSDAGGLFAESYLPDGDYKAVIKDASGVTLDEYDNIGAESTGQIATAYSFNTVALLVADEVLSYTAGAGLFVVTATTDYIEAGGFRYKVAASGATDENLTTTGGVKLYAQPTPAGHVNFAAWGADDTGASSVQTELQDAFDYAHDNDWDLFIPAGIYLVTGLTIPGTVTGTDERAKSFRIFGQGTGEPLTTSNNGSTVIKSTTDAVLLADILDTATSTNGRVIVEGIRFHGNSDSFPVIHLQSFGQHSVMRDSVVRQDGTDNGVEIAWSALATFERVFAFNSDFVTAAIGASRTGIGFSYATASGAGLVTFKECSARGFKDGFKVGGADASNKAISTSLYNCQCSTVYNGVTIDFANGTLIQNLYCEGLDGGTAVDDNGDYTRVIAAQIGSGFAVGIDATNTTVEGNLYFGNRLSIGATVNAVGIDIAVSTGQRKTARDNTIVSTAGTNGVIGLRTAGILREVDLTGNIYAPAAAWTGTSAQRIDDNASDPYGYQQAESGDRIIPMVRQGAITHETVAITQADVSANNLTLPAGQYFELTCSGATTINSFTMANNDDGQIVMIRTTDANATFADTARIFLDTTDTAFNAIGMIMFLIKDISGTAYAYEISRRTLA